MVGVELRRTHRVFCDVFLWKIEAGRRHVQLKWYGMSKVWAIFGVVLFAGEKSRTALRVVLCFSTRARLSQTHWQEATGRQGNICKITESSTLVAP